MHHSTTVEMLVLTAIIVCSVGLFWMRFGKVVAIIRSSRDEAGFQLHPIGPRISQFIWEVLLQSKVIKQRPLPGAAHAFVFWGFIAFALITVNHIASGYGFTLLRADSAFGRIYFGFVAIFAVFVAVSIAGLAIRRFLVRPIWLGKKLSYESGLIALLIFTLMVTYLTGWLYEDRVSWWLHTLALFLFLPLIPHTKHLHLVLSPATIFARRNGFSAIPPLSGDEDFGLDAGKDLTKVDALQAFSCVECGRCTEHCPAYNTGKVLNPKEIILGLRGYLREHGPGAEQPLVGTHISEEAIFQCTTCGSCEFQCPVGIQHLPEIIGLRRGMVNTGKWEDEYGGKFFLTLEKNGNSLGFQSSERTRFIEKNELPIFDGTQEYCLWLGCMGSYDPQGREIVLSLVKVLRHLGITFGVLRKERCTGDPARRLGNDLLFQQMAEQNIETLKAANVGKMVSICPHCVRTIGTDWKEVGTTFEIEHHTELLARFRSKLPSTATEDRIAYHDPCYLGRYRGSYDQPREVLSGFAQVTEPERSRERSFCCGAGGGMMFLGEEKGKRVNIERAEQLVATGANVVGTACPFCQTMFRDALGTVAQGSAPKLMDVVQIAAAALPDALRGTPPPNN